MVVAGNAADRFPRRNVGMFAHTILTVAAAGLAAVSWLNAPTPMIYALLVLVGIARSFAAPSVNTILPQLLAPTEFANANAWLSSTFQLAAISGPAVGGLLIAATGVGHGGVRHRGGGAGAVHPDAAHAAGEGAAAGRGAPERGRRVRGVHLRAAQPVVPRGDHARPVRGAVRRRGGAAAHLREGHPRGGSRRPRLAARGPGPRRAW